MNSLQKAVAWMFTKATGFPPWTGSFSTSNYSGQLAQIGSVTPALALQLAEVFGCCRIRGGTVGSLPLHIYKDTKGGRVRDDGHALYEILHSTPNAFMTSMEWREAMMLAMDLTGNGFSEIQRLGDRIVSFNPLLPERMQFGVKNGKLQYQYTYDDGKMEIFPQEKVLHFRNFSLDGINGLSPIQRKAIQLGLASQDHATAFLKNGARPSVVLASEQGMPSPEAQDALRKSAEKMYGGAENAGRLMFTWGGLKPSVLTMSPADAQLLETMKLTGAAIATLYGVPLAMLSQSDRAETFASAEQADIRFAKHTIRPIAVRIEQTLNKALKLGAGVYVEFDMEALMRGDAQSQASFISTMVQNGVMTRNEARRKFNLPDYEGGDELTVQSNMLDLDMLSKVAAAKIQPPTNQPAPQPAKSATQTINVVPEIKTQMDPVQIAEFRDEIRESLARPRTMRKVGKAKRRDDGVMEFEIEETVN